MPLIQFGDIEHSGYCYDILMLYRYIVNNGVEIKTPSLLTRSMYNTIIEDMFSISIEFNPGIALRRVSSIPERVPAYIRQRTYISYANHLHRNILEAVIENLPSKYLVERRSYYYLIWTEGRSGIGRCIYLIQLIADHAFEPIRARLYNFYYDSGYNLGLYSNMYGDATETNIERKERDAWDRSDIVSYTDDSYSAIRDAFRRGFYDGYAKKPRYRPYDENE